MIKRDLYSDASLIEKLLVDDLSEDEKQKILDLLEKRGLLQVYDDLKNSSYIHNRLSDYGKYSSEKAYKYFLRHRKKTHYLHVLSRMGVAVLLAGIVLGIVFWEEPFRQEEKAGEFEVCIPAGMAQARLTLADGKVINVAQVDTLKDQGVAIEYKNGELSYKKATDTTIIAYNELEVPRGGECALVLDDGTKVWVNSESRLRYPLSFEGEERSVYLEGEAFFDVAKADKSFVVRNPFGEVRVLGTVFGLTAFKIDSVSYTTLVRGCVRVSNNASDSLTIYPGEQAIASRDGKMIKREVDVEEYVGWKDGVFIFKERRLEDIVKILERWYDIDVVFQDDELKDFRFTGYLDRYKDMNVFFKALKRTEKVDYKMSDMGIVILTRKD